MGCTQSSKSVTGIHDPKDLKADKAGKPKNDGKNVGKQIDLEHEESKSKSAAIEGKTDKIIEAHDPEL
jgi:hypothetical protein